MRTGKLEEAALKRSVLRILYSEDARWREKYGEDCGFFQGGSVQAASCASFVPGFEDRPDQILLSCANNLFAGGCTPKYFILQAVFPDIWEEKDIRRKMQELAEQAGRMGIAAAGGHTEISAAVSEPVYAVTCLGERNETGAAAIPRPGWDLVVTRWIGLGGTAALAKRREGELKEVFPPALIERAKEFEIWMSVEREAKIIGRYGSCVMHDLSQGGIFGGLWELGERWKFGMEVDLKKIPIRQETVEICEYFQVNPYNLYSGGSLIAGTEHGEDLVRELEREGIPAVCIGKILKERARKIYNGEECRFLDRPAQDEWYRLQERFDLKTRRETE